MIWNNQTIERLRALWDEGLSTPEIGRRLNASKNAIIGKAHRLNLPARPSPIRTGTAQPRGPAKPKPPRLIEVIPQRSCPPQIRTADDHGRDKSEPPPQPVNPIPAERPTRAAIGPHPCCWPIGDPGTSSFRFCEATALTGKPYCEEHSRRAYTHRRDAVGEDRHETAR